MAVITPALDRDLLGEIADTCAYFHVRRATRELAGIYDEALRPHGLRGTQFTLLVAIGLLGNGTTGALAEAVSADRTTLTRTLAPLERHGLIVTRLGDDRRERVHELTEAGSERVAAATPAWRAAQRLIADGIGADAWQGLMAGAGAVHEMSRRMEESK